MTFSPLLSVHVWRYRIGIKIYACVITIINPYNLTIILKFLFGKCLGKKIEIHVFKPILSATNDSQILNNPRRKGIQ